MYQAFSRSATVRCANAAGWPTDSTASRSHAFWRHQRERPRDARAPVVADDVRALDLQRVQNRDRVGDAAANAIVVDLFRLARLAEAAQVGRDHAQSGAREGRDLVAPEPRGVGEAVQQEHRRTFALVEHRQLDAVAVDPPHDRAAYVVWSLLNARAIETVRPHRHKSQCEGH